MSAARSRVLDAAMRLFGERGYAATTIAQIEAAAGLSPGSGGLYAHFTSKEALLRAGLDAILAPDPHLFPADPGAQDTAAAAPIDEQLDAMARAGLARLQHDRDLNRILVRDLRALPDLLQLAADREIRPIHDRLTGFLTAAMGPDTARRVDARALAAVLVGATSHYWLITDIYGGHPAGVSEDDYVATLVRCVSALITQGES